MRRKYSDDRLKFYIGDVRDYEPTDFSSFDRVIDTA